MLHLRWCRETAAREGFSGSAGWIAVGGFSFIPCDFFTSTPRNKIENFGGSAQFVFLRTYTE
jgi:hypothetical protein